jgi:threonine dehydrogenase-like Zn-dependent dehydrogenase
MTMAKAAVLVAPGRLEIQEFPLPRLEDGALLLKMELSGICGTDKHTYRGEVLQYSGTGAEMRTPFPIIPGHENVGVVAEITPLARHRLEFDGQTLAEGDRLVMCPDVVCGHCHYCRYGAGYLWCDNMRSYGNSFSSAQPPHLMGGWADYLYIRPDAFVYKVPDGLPPRVAVLAELFACSWSLDKAKEFYALDGEGFQPGGTVVVQGVGPLGLLHVIKARLLGAAQVIAIDLSPYRLALAARCGADVTLDAGRTTAAERRERVLQLTHGLGANVVVECVGRPEVLVEGLEMTMRGGVYLETGNFVDAGSVTLNPHRHLLAKNVRLLGVSNHPVTAYAPGLRLIQAHPEVPWADVVTDVYPVEQAAAALARSLQPDCMKVAIAGGA